MQKYYQLQTEFPTLSCAGKFGVNFATESEEERNCQLHVTGLHPLMRDRFVQTSSVRKQSVAIQFRTPAVDVETQIGADTNSVATQLDYQAGFDNFGLPPTLDVATIVRATRRRGTTETWVTRELELKYYVEQKRRFTPAEKSNVDAMVRTIMVAREDERRTICKDFSCMVRGETVIGEESPTGSLSGEPILSTDPPEIETGKGEGECSKVSSGDCQKHSAPGAPHSQPEADQGNPFDDW